MPRLPWTATAAALTAYTALFVSGGPSLVLPLLGLGLLASHMTDSRLENKGWTPWAARLIVYSAIVALNTGRQTGLVDLFFTAQAMDILGQLSAGELALQAWLLLRFDARLRTALILLAGIVLLAAGMTFEDHYVRWFAPVYFLFLALSLRRPVTHAERPRQSRTWAMAAPGGVALFLALLIGAGMYGSFFTFRNQLMLWGERFLSDQHPPEEGTMAAQPHLGETFGLRGTLERVLRLDGYSGEGYLRGMAFDTYRGGEWGPPMESRRLTAVGKTDLGQNASASQARVTCLADDSGLLFAPLHTAGLQPQALTDLEWARSDGGPIRTRAAVPFSYGLVLGREAYQGPLDVPPGARARAADLQVPRDLDPRIRALALQVGGAAPNPHGKVDAVVNYLITHHGYSLTFHPGPGDPVSGFLLSDKPAHCEYFASSAVLLLRLLGVPTRYVTGYLAHESEGAGITVVRQRDAHAWAESWIDGQGWMTVDATPGSGRPDSFSNTVSPWRKAWERFGDEITFFRLWVAALTRAQILLLVGGLAAFLLCVQLWRRFWARRRPGEPGFIYTLSEEELAALSARFDDWLRRHDLPCPPDRPWSEHLAQAAQQAPAASTLDLPKAEAFVAQYNAVRFGVPGDPDSVTKLRILLQGLEKEEI